MNHQTVLVVEDNPVNMKLVKDLLQLGNYTVLEACEAKTGILLTEEHKPDLILMDIQLPGMDGLTATQQIKKNADLKDIPVIALTAHAMIGDDEKTREAGCDGYISKPIDTRNFLKQIDKFIEIKSNKAESSAAKGTHHKNKIIIIDDDPLNAKLLASKLPADKYEVKIISSGIEIIKTVIKEHPDLIMMDVMITGMNSCELTGKLKNNPETKNIPIIVITPIDGKNSKEKSWESGVDEFINKPINSIELISRVSSVIRLKQYHDQLANQNHNRPAESTHAGCNHEGYGNEGKRPLSVLLLSDVEQDVKLILSYLQDQSYRVLHVDNFDKALSFAHEKKIALIILDKTSLDTNELEACRRLKSIYQTEDIPFIVVTRIQELESKSEVIDLGVDDFLIKPLNSQELRARIDLLLKKKIYIQSLYPCDNTDDKSSIYDKVTGLHSYNYFKHFLGLELKKSLRHNYPVSLIMIRIDSLRYGSALSAQTGADRMILKLAQIIKSNVRETDLATRFSENEVAVILSYCDNNTALGIINRIRQLFASHDTCYIETSPQLKSTLSVGVAFCPHHSQTSDELMEKAKDMLDKARKEGMNRVCVYG